MAYSLKYRRYRSRRPSRHAVTEVRAERNYTLWLRFDDGLEGHVYLGDLVGTPVFGRSSSRIRSSGRPSFATRSGRSW